MRMRIMEKTIAVLLVICMLFSFMPTEMMSGVLEDVFADIPSSSNFQGTFVFEGEWNPIGPMSRNTPIIRVVLSRDSDTYLNGSKEAYNNMLNAFSYRYPISSTDTSKHTQNTLFFSTQAMYDKWTYHVNITGEERLWKAPVTYYSGNPTTGCISKYGEDVRNMFVIFKGSSKNNTFKTKVVNAYNNKTIGGSTDLAGGVWKNYLPTQAEAYALCSYLFTRESGFQERVLEVVDQNFNMSNLDVKNLDNKGKFNIIAGYTGLLSALYVVADAQGQKDLASAYDTAIEDYLSNNNIKQQPVTLIVDTCLLFTENAGTRHIMPSIDVVEYSLATNSNFSILDDDAFLKNLEKAGKRKTTITSTSGRTKGFSLREQIEEMAWASLEAYPFATTKGYINGSNDTTQKKVYRLADLPNLNSIYTNQQHGNPLGYCLTVVSLAAASDPSGKGRGEMFTSSSGPLWNSYDWGSGHFLDIFYTGENGFLDGFAIMGSHMSDPNPSADFTVVDTLQGSPDTCEEFVQLITPTKITVNIGNGSDFLAFLDTLPEDSKISLSANISRTEYKNSLKSTRVDYIEHLTALENDLFLDKVSVETFKNKVVKTIILEDDYFLDSSGSPKTYTRSTNDASLVIFEYAIDLTLTVDETVYEFKSDDIVSRIGDVPQNSSSFQIKAYKSNTTPAEDIEILAPEDRTKPNYTHNPSAQEDLAHNTQVVRWYEFTSVMGSLSSNVDASFGSTMGYDDMSVDADIGAFAEIKSNKPGDEKYEVLGGIPSTEELYFSVGGSEWKVSMIMQYWMNEHSRDRTYTMHFDGTTCEFNNNQKDNGDIWEGITLPSASGASQSTTRFEHTGTTVTATWTGSIPNDAVDSIDITAPATGHGSHSTSASGEIVAVPNHTDYLAAVQQANDWMAAMNALSDTFKWKAASDEKERSVTIPKMDLGTGGSNTASDASGGNNASCSDGTWLTGSATAKFTNPKKVTKTVNNSSSCNEVQEQGYTDSEGSYHVTTPYKACTATSPAKTETLSKGGAGSFTITVTYTIAAHTICGPCCGHVLPDLWDTWKQGLVFDYMKISQIRLFLLDQGSVEGMTDLTGTDRITASVVSGNPTYFMNIATHTEQIRDPYMTAGGTADLEGTKQGNTWFTHTEYSSSAVYGELPHLSTYNTREAQSSRAGRIRYLLDANWEATATKSFNYQYGPGGTTDGVGGNKSGTLTIDYNKVANSKHHDDVVYDLGTRTPNCDGMATSGNFGKDSTLNTDPTMTTGHVNKWADGMLYTNIMDLEDFDSYWDTGSYGNSYAPTQMRDNDKNLVKFKEDYGHHNPEDGLTKTKYGHHADIVDSRTAEWQVFDAARKTKIVAVVISDFLIMQTSGGDQAVFYYEKASEPTEAQEHFQKVSIPEEELTTNNPLSVFNAGAVCEASSLKDGIANFEIVGGYNGRYDVPSKKYMPYSLVTKQFLSNNSNSWSVYNTSYQISNGKITNADKKIGVESNYNKYGNSKIVTIFDDDPAGSFNRPARQAEGTGLKIYQDNLQILPTTPNKYYQPNNASIWYIQVLGMFSAGGPYYNHATGTYNVHTAGNVNLGHPYREKYGSAWTDYWGVEFGLQLNTKYYLTPNGDSNTGTVNGVVVYTPVSAEDAIILPQGDLNVNGVTVSRDQRVDNFAFPNMNEIANALKVCTLDPATCEYRYLDCKYLHDTVVAEFDFEDSYSVSGKTYVTNNITGIEYALPSGYSVSSGTSFANSSGRYLVATGTNSWSIPFADLGLSNDKTNRVKVSMDLYVTTSARDVMISGFRNLGFIVDTSGQGKFIIPELNDPTMLGTSKSFTQNMKKVHLDIVFGFNNIIDCTAYVNGVEATVHQVVDFRNQWTETVVNGQTIRKLEQTHVVLDANALRTTPPRNLSTGDIMASLNIGTWGNTESTYNASFYLDNLSVVLMGGSTEHTSACYVTATTHAVSKVHVCDENCYLKEDWYTCDGLPNANYTHSASSPNNWFICNGVANVHEHTSACYTAVSSNTVKVAQNNSLTKEYVATTAGTLTVSGYGSCSAERWIAQVWINGVEKYNYSAASPGSFTYNYAKNDIVKFYVYSYDSCTVGWNVSWTAGSVGELTGGCTGTLNKHVHSGSEGETANGCYTKATHKHYGTAGLDYANGCYTVPTVHKHNLSYSYTDSELICGMPEGGTGEVRNYTTFGATTVNLPAGRYKLEVWGAQGGNSGGKGGYSVGEITLTQATTVYVYVGQQGTNDSVSSSTRVGSAAFNGGGKGSDSTGSYTAPSGGGGTDIRVGTDSLYARVIVAGGGGARGSYSSQQSGGYGGGATGGSSGDGTPAGSQTSAGIGQYNDGVAGNGTHSGIFGRGGNSSSQNGNAGGGGGGWYGGASGYNSGSGGGGGSGYVYTSSTASSYPSGCLLNSSYHLTNAQTIAGNTSFTAPGGGAETGHAGNGYARITNLDHTHTASCYKSNTVSYSTTCPKEAKGTYKCTGEPNTLTDFNVHVHDINCFYNYYDLTPRTYKATGNVITYMVPYTDVYKIETWGAADGTRSGYASGYVKLIRGTRLFFYIGTKDGFNDGNTDIRTYDIMYSYDEIMAMESAADRHEWLLAYNESLASRFINAGADKSESFVRNVGQYSLTSGTTSTIGNSSDGQIVITPQNRLPLEKDDTYILEQIIQGDISEEQVEKYLGKELADLIINATQPFATFENFSWNNYKGIAKSQNNYSFKNGNIVVDVAKGGCYEFILPVNISARALRRVVVTFDNYTSSTNFGLAINQANDAHRILKPITANKANQTVEFNVRDLAWNDTVTKLIFNPSTNTNLGKVVIKKIELFGHAEYTEFTPNSTYTYDNIATITGFSSTNTNGFVVGNNVQLSYNNSDMRVKAIGNDPITLWNSVKSIPTDSVRAIKIVFKNDQTSASTGQLFYKDGTGTFNETDSFSWHVGASSYGYQTVWIDCVNHSTYNETTDTFTSGGSGWTGTITGMRFDWTTASNATIDVKEITFIGKGSVSIKHTFNYLEKAQAIKLTSGKWNLDLYGAQGGDGRVVNTTTMVEAGGKGGRTQGTLTANGSTTYYVYVGGKGGSAGHASLAYGAGGWNGGAPGGTELSGETYPENGAGGGGMTHITTSSSDMLTYKGTFGTTQVVDIPKGTQYTFNYTGSVQSIKLPKGEWKIEAYGAQGGGEANQSYSSHAGLGGYTSGIVNADGNTTYYIYVGGQGTLSSGLGTGAGWNGGGHGGANGYGGGGMTHITTSSTDAEGTTNINVNQSKTVSPLATPVVVKTATSGTGNVSLTPGIYYLEATGAQGTAGEGGMASGWLTVTSTGTYYYSVGTAGAYTWINSSNSATNALVKAGSGAMAGVAGVTGGYTTHTHDTSCSSGNPTYNTSGGTGYTSFTAYTVEHWNECTYCGWSDWGRDYYTDSNRSNKVYSIGIGACSCPGSVDGETVWYSGSYNSTGTLYVKYNYTCNNLPLNSGYVTPVPAVSAQSEQTSSTYNLKEGKTVASASIQQSIKITRYVDLSGQTIVGNVSFTATNGYTASNSNSTTAFGTYTYKGAGEVVSLPAGTYIIEVWGAQGGSNTSYNVTGKSGGYVKGTYSPAVQTDLFIVVGGAGGNATSGIDGSSSLRYNGGFNGGGSGSGSAGPGGGGATHIQIGSTGNIIKNNYGNSHSNTTGDFKGAASSMSNLLLIAYGGGAGSSAKTGTVSYMNGSNGNTGYYNSGSYYEDNGGGGAGYKGGICGQSEDDYHGANGTSYVNTSYLTSTSTSAGSLTGNGKVVISRVRTEYTNNPTIGDVSFTTTVSRTVKTMTFDTSKVLIVAGGGGGADNVHGAVAAGGSDDGSGGAGGGTTGGNALIDGVAQANTGGTQSSGYARGVGETVTTATDTGGGGGGWYGGKVTNNNNGGAGGGSGYYNTSKVTSGSTQAGKRAGDGYVVITLQKDIMKDSNTLGFTQTYSFDTTKVIAVAGGGGGASGHLSDTTTVDRTWGGNGGGTTGATTNTNTTAGTQSSGYEKQGMGGPGWSYNYTGGTHLNYGSSGGGGGGWYGGYTSTGLTDTTTRGGAGGSGYFNTSKVTGGSTTAGVRSGNGLAVLTSNGLTGIVALNAGPDSVTEVTFTTGTYTGTPFKATYVNPFENETARQTIHNNIDLIPTLVDGDYNPIFVCKFQEKNAHECQIVNDNGTIQNLCVTTVRLDCTEPHHKGVREGEFDDLGKPICREHYSGGNRICWSACGNDDNHKLTKNEVDVDGDGTTVLQLAEFLQIDEGFTVYFPNRGNFYGNGLLGLASPQTTRGYGYKNNMDTTRWTREKRVMFPFTVLYEGLTYNAYSWIELDVNEEYFNFYLPVSTPEVANGRVVFEVEAINCGTKEGTNPLFNITYSSTVDNNYTNALNTFIDGYLELYQNSVKRTGYKIIRAQVNENKAGAGHRLAYSEVGILAFIEERQDRVSGPTSKLIKALEEIDRQVEYDFERDRGDYINPNNANTAGSINERLKPLTMNDNLERYDNTLRSDAYQSLHGGYKKFYLDILGRIGNFAITDTEDFRFSNFFKVAIVSNDDTAGLEDPNNWLVDGLVKQVDENVQNYYVGDLYDIRGNKASVNTRWLDTYGTQSWMAGTITENGDRNVNKKNLVSQILTGDVNTIEVLEDHELSYGYDIFTSIVTFGSYQEGQVQIIPKYYALKVSDKNLSGIPSKYNVNKGVYVPLDVYVNKDGAYEPVNIFGNASNGNKNKAGVQLSDYVFNLDWTNEAGRRNYSLDEQARTNRVKEFYKTYIYDYNNNMQDPSEYTPSYDIQVIDVIEYTTPDGEVNYLGTPQYILMDGRHRTFIGDSKSYDNNVGGQAIWNGPAEDTNFGLDKGAFPNAHTGGASQIDPMEFERAVQRWHSKIGLPSSAVFVPHGETVNATTLEYIMGENEDEWVIVCTAEIIAVGAVWNLNYSQPWFSNMTVGGETFKTHQHTSGCTCNKEDHYPGHRIGDTLCPWCIDPIIAVFGKTSVNDVEISQIY